MADAPDYASHSEMSSPGRHRELVADLPADVAGAAKAVQGLCIHDFVAEPLYGFKVPPARSHEIHIRPAEALIDRLLDMEPGPLSQTRPVANRLVVRCRHYALLHISALREKGIPARLRGGFAAYFNPPYYEDHWITEYWNADEARWVLADPQLDDVWMARLGSFDDPLDLGRQNFIVSADAWKMCRNGRADPAAFGIGAGNLRGLWFVAGSLIRDLAALNKVEMLPWDVWGAQPMPDKDIPADDLALLDDIADLTSDPDCSPADLAALYSGDARLTVRGRVFNAITTRMEPVGDKLAA
jgi:hypothetical protein